MFRQRFWDSSWLARLVLALLGLALVSFALSSLFRGRLTYPNYWGGVVFAPFAIALGAFVLAFVVLQWNKLNERERKQALKGKAARKAQKLETEAQQYRSMIDDFDKPWRGQS